MKPKKKVVRVLGAQEALRMKLPGHSTGWSSSSQMHRSESPFPQDIFYPWQASPGYSKKISQQKERKPSDGWVSWTEWWVLGLAQERKESHVAWSSGKGEGRHCPQILLLCFSYPIYFSRIPCINAFKYFFGLYLLTTTSTFIGCLS